MRIYIGLDYQVKNPNEIKEKFNVAVDCSGSAPAMEAAISLLDHGGRMCIFGVANPKAKLSIEPFQVNLSHICKNYIFLKNYKLIILYVFWQVYKKELTILGVLMNPYSFLKGLALVQPLSEKYLDFNKLGIKVFALSQYKEALDALKKGNISKVVFKL